MPKKRPKSGYANKLCKKIEADALKKNYDLLQIQEEMYGYDTGDIRDLNVVYDCH